ncbi:peptidylprolyl isomerase [Aurantibacter aestuarii]|uniref:Peptidyl-prolyl cis-trans isomerase n=1 Tax=Aurantibacter aestuarii TaxID=1266046 RepID=A0A2T1N602_9FLAO|nr:peptidylprolyl isomerase [Aurantibacter aestuarii]PSG86586.1 peptidylprolyl isomerase [Aurantibacter aestuarii]
MQKLSWVILSFIILSCQSNTSKNTTEDTTQDNIKATKVIKKDTVKKPKKTYPYLDEDNAMEFFLEYEKENKETKVRLTTTFGDIEILLYNETKFHRANFIYLTKLGAFDNTQFHRVVENFIIQGGNTDNVDVAKRRRKIGHYLLPTDTNRGFTHKRGVISMPSSDIENPHKLASPYEFFIVQTDSYHLDGDYTIFGEVIKGMDVVDKINSVRTDEAEWPLHNVYIEKAEILE